MRKYMLAIVGILILAVNANAAFPVNDAGIAAYVRVGESVDLNKTLGAYEEIVNINKLDIIGKIRVHDGLQYSIPLVYVGADGWIVAYYPKSEPASRIMQWNGYSPPYINTTTLADAILKMTTVLGVNNESIKGNITYYDFRYPEANEMMMLVNTGKSRSFSILIPDTVILYNASFSFSTGQGGLLRVDKTDVTSPPGCGGGGFFYGFYNLDLFKNNILHTVYMTSNGFCDPGNQYGSTVLIFRRE